MLPGTGLGLHGECGIFVCCVHMKQKVKRRDLCVCLNAAVCFQYGSYEDSRIFCVSWTRTDPSGSMLDITHGYTLPCFAGMCGGNSLVCFCIFHCFIILLIVCMLRPLNSVCFKCGNCSLDL